MKYTIQASTILTTSPKLFYIHYTVDAIDKWYAFDKMYRLLKIDFPNKYAYEWRFDVTKVEKTVYER